MSPRLHITLGTTALLPEGRTVVTPPPSSAWPFVYPLAIDLPREPAVLYVEALHEAFVNRQTAGTRLVTTQPAYLLQAWLDQLADRDVLIVATADRDALERHAPEVLEKLGATGATGSRGARGAGATGAMGATTAAVEALIAAFRADDPRERLRLCVRALNEGRTPATLLAAASVCMEVNDLDAAERDLDEAVAAAPDWAAVHFERGKLFLRRDDMERASDAFRAATERMPAYGPAWANLGATLGELDRPGEALDAFSRALACDPGSAQTLNNIGVVSRELGKLGESEAAFRRVIELSPDLAFGYYNLGHTLFLQGRYQAALTAYAEGQKRDPERNPVQASRLAMCRLATGDPAGALRDLQQATGALPRDYRQQLLADTHTIAWALLTHRPDLAGWQQVNDWLTRELSK